MDRNKLVGLNPNSYEHPWDTNAKKLLKAVPLDVVMKKFNESFSDKITMMEHKASYLEINSNQYSRVYEIFADCCQILDIPQLPLFLVRSAEINAYTAGVAKPLVCITSGCVQFLSENELRFIFGHELGHIKSEHLLYKSIAIYLQRGGNEVIIGCLPPLAGAATIIAINSAFYKWNRMSEYTADRAGLLCVQNINDAISALSKLAGFISGVDESFNTEEFMNQAERFHQEYQQGTEAVMANIRIMLGNVTHPYTVSRVYELNNWYNQGEYDNIIRLFEKNAMLPDKTSGNNISIIFK